MIRIWNLFSMIIMNMLLPKGHLKAVAYIEVLEHKDIGNGEGWWGAGVDTDIIISSIQALISALNRMEAGR
ncbi:MAG: hypothetical protein D3923_16735 [Candidatus Electrothrix sp. AR3]|nr:hypothetical protein [Candidatus Electrothrix sp. AR3]